jgi:xylulose-5-phosphate/fructose-6-phosphate phosphoketolase
MRSYKAEELFDEAGRLMPELAELAPKGDRRMGANPHANGGALLHDLVMPDFRAHAVDVRAPGAVNAQDTMVLGNFLRDVSALNAAPRNFRIFGPDETLSNLLGAVFEVTPRQWDARTVDDDEFLAPERPGVPIGNFSSRRRVSAPMSAAPSCMTRPSGRPTGTAPVSSTA